MSDPSFSTDFTVDRGPDEVFAECFDACSNAWRHYVNTSLRNRIVTGRSER